MTLKNEQIERDYTVRQTIESFDFITPIARLLTAFLVLSLSQDRFSKSAKSLQVLFYNAFRLATGVLRHRAAGHHVLWRLSFGQA